MSTAAQTPTRPRTRPILSLIAIAVGVAAGALHVLHTGDASAASAKDESRWSDAFGASGPQPAPTATATKGDRLAPVGACAGQDWPYLARQCLVEANGGELRTATRTVTIETRLESQNTSVLVRLPVAQVALQ